MMEFTSPESAKLFPRGFGEVTNVSILDLAIKKIQYLIKMSRCKARKGRDILKLVHFILGNHKFQSKDNNITGRSPTGGETGRRISTAILAAGVTHAQPERCYPWSRVVCSK